MKMLKLITILILSYVLGPTTCAPRHTLLDELEDSAEDEYLDRLLDLNFKDYIVNAFRNVIKNNEKAELDFIDEDDIVDNDEQDDVVDEITNEIVDVNDESVAENDEHDETTDDESNNSLSGHDSDRKANIPAPPEDVDANINGKVRGDDDRDELDHGDIMFRPGERQDFFQSQDESYAYPASDASKTDRKWPKGIVPYVISKSLGSSHREAIREAIAEYAKKTCIRLVPRKNEKNYISFEKKRGCWSYVGMSGGEQTLSLGIGCDDKSTAVHEIMHALGFWHEQSRPDRDSYINIIMDNIPKEKQHNFEKKKATEVDMLGFSYDYYSVMHYKKKAFGKYVNGVKQITIVPKNKKVQNFGQCWSCGLSETDAGQLNKLYCTLRPLQTDRLIKQISRKMMENKNQNNDAFRKTLLRFLKNRYQNYYWTVSVYNAIVGSNRHAYQGSCVHVWQYYNKNVLACFVKKTSSPLNNAGIKRIGDGVAKALQDRGCHATKSIGFAFKRASSFGYPIASVQIVRHGSGLFAQWLARTVFINFRCRKAHKKCNSKKQKCKAKMSTLIIMFK